MKKFLICLIIFFSSIVQAEGRYKIEMVKSGKSGWGAIRYIESTGEAWMVRRGVFVPIKEPDQLPFGTYKIRMTSTHKAWSATRVEVYTGKGWHLKNGNWVKILEAE